MTLEASLASAEAACRDLEADVQVREGNGLHRLTWSSRQADNCWQGCLAGLAGGNFGRGRQHAATPMVNLELRCLLLFLPRGAGRWLWKCMLVWEHAGV